MQYLHNHHGIVYPKSNKDSLHMLNINYSLFLFSISVCEIISSVNYTGRPNCPICYSNYTIMFSSPPLQTLGLHSAVCTGLIYVLLLELFTTQRIVAMINDWYLIPSPFNSIDMIISGKNVNSFLRLSYIVYYVTELSYIYGAYMISLLEKKLR